MATDNRRRITQLPTASDEELSEDNLAVVETSSGTRSTTLEKLYKKVVESLFSSINIYVGSKADAGGTNADLSSYTAQVFDVERKRIMLGTYAAGYIFYAQPSTEPDIILFGFSYENQITPNNSMFSLRKIENFDTVGGVVYTAWVTFREQLGSTMAGKSLDIWRDK